MNKIRWGIIGPGSIAHNFADALKQSYSGELLAIASRTSSRLEEFGNKYNINEEFRFNDYDQLLDDENIDAVYISTPHVFHADLSIKAAGKGKGFGKSGMKRGARASLMGHGGPNPHECGPGVEPHGADGTVGPSRPMASDAMPVAL